MKINTNNVTLTISAGRRDQFPRDGLPEIAFSGRSNVGKSSLINTLLNRKSLARVSSAPGKTVTVNFYDVDGKFRLVDLPGYGYARRSGEKRAAFSGVTEQYFTDNPARKEPPFVIQLIDSRVGPTEDDTMMMQYLVDTDTPFIVIATKTDKLKRGELDALFTDLHDNYFNGLNIPVVGFSSQTKEGRDALWSYIISHLTNTNKTGV